MIGPTPFAAATPTVTGYAEVTPEEVAQRPRGIRVVDVREPGEYAGELGHVPGAELVPLGTVGDQASTWSKHELVVVVCRSGARSARAAGLLVARGFQRVFNMKGGMIAYTAAGLPIERTRT